MNPRTCFIGAALSAIAAALLAAGSVWAQAASPADSHAGHAGHGTAAPAASTAAADLADGEVRRIDREARKLTLRHGEIRSLSMPPMTMVFQVADPALLDRVKVGDKVRFRADQKDGAYRVTELQPAP